jgi:hypothetical protein
LAIPAHREADDSPPQDPRFERRRLDVQLDALRREMAARPVETPGRIRTIVDEVRWRRQLRRSLSGGMTVTAWVIALLLISITILAVIVAVNVYGPVWSLLLSASI